MLTQRRLAALLLLGSVLALAALVTARLLTPRSAVSLEVRTPCGAATALPGPTIVGRVFTEDEQRYARLRHDPTERIAKWERYMNGLKQLDSGRDADSLEIPGVGVRPVRLRIGREDSRASAAAEQAFPPAREDRR